LAKADYIRTEAEGEAQWRERLYERGDAVRDEGIPQVENPAFSTKARFRSV
jgi:hypothetical protein